MPEIPPQIAGMLAAARNGERAAIDQLFALLYPELREQARKRMRTLEQKTMLDTTSLVHESYLRLTKAGSLQLESRQHFLAYAAHVMRSVVIDFVRSAQALRRGGNDIQVTLNSSLIDQADSSADEITILSEFLDKLAEADPRLVSVVEMRYFAALKSEEIAQCLGVTERTVRRDLEKARLLLLDARSSE